MLKRKIEKRLQSRQWQIIAPAEWQNISAITDKIKLVCKNYYFIKHDQDIDEFGKPKFIHYHLLFSFGSPRDINTVSNYFEGIENLLPNSFEKINSIHWAKRYLVHADDPQKFQYDYNDVETNDKLFPDLFIPVASKMQGVHYLMYTFSKIESYANFFEFISNFENQLCELNFYQRTNMVITLRRYYDTYHNNLYKSEAKEWDKGFQPVSNDETLPF